MIDINEINKAIALTQEGKFDEAESIYSKLLSENQENPSLLAAAGLFYINKKDYVKAIDNLTKAWNIKKTAGTVSAIGFAHFELKNYEAAADWLEKSIEYGENADIYGKLILSLFQIHDYKKAIKYSKVMYEKYPDNPNSVAHMVKSLTQSGKLLEAERMCVTYLREHQDCAGLWLHLGFLKELIYSDDKQACECFKIAADLGNIDAFYNIAVSYQKQGNYTEAEKYYKKMLELCPDDTEVITSYGMCLMKQKKFKAGYELFFKRQKSVLDKKTKNKWTPGKEFEKEIVVICDQGYGDHIQFARYLPIIKEKTDKLYVASRDALTDLFKENYSDIEFISYNDINPNMQSIRITDLAYALNIDFNNIPSSKGYLKAGKKELTSDKIKVGLCWEAGGAGIRTMINRTINIKFLEPIIKLENIQLYSFQVEDSLGGNESYPQMINLAKNFHNFKDTAEALNGIDLLITVDTSVAHLAGALGIKTWLLLPYTTDWRWFDDNKTSPWYDSIEIFKQKSPISWEEPVKEIVCRLSEYSL